LLILLAYTLNRDMIGTNVLQPSDITLPGFYWYFDPIGGPAIVVEVAGERKRDLVVRFTGREDEDALSDLSGSFIGPITPPVAV
jgi:hypothetical protein